MEKLVVFDVDGVLIDTELGSFKDLGVMLGKEKEIKKHHEEYERRKYLGPWGLEELATIFTGIKESEIKKAVKNLLKRKLMPGIRETIDELKRRGYLVVSYSSSPIWIMSELQEEYGLDDVLGNIVEVRDGKVTGKLLKKVDRYAKAERLRRFMEERGIAKEDTYVIGDSLTDLPMAEYGRFIAFNADKQEVKDKAEFVINKKDLREILRYINQ